MTDESDKASHDPFFVGQHIGGQFEVEEVLGHNELGSAYLVLKTDNRRHMMLKTLPMDAMDDAGYERLRADVREASTIPHKNLAKIYGIGREGDAAFVVMEHLEGQALARYLGRRREKGEALNPKGVFNIVGHICSALKTLHKHGSHGVLTPKHVFVTRKGRVKLLNLAYGHAVASLLHTRAEGAYADSPFIAPEVRVTPSMRSSASDIYALGILTAEMLSSTPLEGHGEAARQRALAIAGEFGQDILTLITEATSYEPSARTGTAAEYRERLKAIVEAPSVTVSAPPGMVTTEPEPEPEPLPVAHSQQINIGPPLGEEALADDAPTPNPKDTVDPFAKAAEILGQTGAINAAEVQQAAKGEGARYLVSMDGLDYGPFSYDQVIEQLHEDQIDEFTSILDRATQIRLPMQDIEAFARAVEDYIPVRQERRRLETERRAQMVQTAKTAGRWTVYAGIGAGLLVGLLFGVYWYFVRAKPAALPEGILLADVSKDYKMLPPPKEFGQINVDENMLAALFNEGGKKGGRRFKPGKRRPGKKGSGKGGGVVDGGGGDDNFVDFNQTGGTDHVLTDAEISRGVLSHFGSLQSCLAPELKRNPSFRGVRVKFFIKPSGTTGGVTVLEGSYNSGPVGSCLKTRFRGMKFPAHGGFNRGVIFPLIIKR